MTEKTDKKKKRRTKKFEIPDEYKVETIYDYFTFSCSSDYALAYLGLCTLIDLQNSYAEQEYREGD
jgi:hypothetical protein